MDLFWVIAGLLIEALTWLWHRLEDGAPYIIAAWAFYALLSRLDSIQSEVSRLRAEIRHIFKDKIDF